MGMQKNRKIIGSASKGTIFAAALPMKNRILIADDDPGLRDIFRIILEKAGYDLEIKEDADEILKNNFKIPDLFLIDKLLSGIDGLEVCRHLKNDPRTKNIPVIMVSASPDIGPAAAKAGADDFVEKPFELTYLLEVIQRHISNGKKNEKNLRRVRDTQVH